MAAWGKPQYFHSWCFGGPRLAYSDASVIFDPATNSVMAIRLEVMLHSYKCPAATSGPTIEECIGNLGEPTSRKNAERDGDCELIYSSHRETLRLRIVDGRLFTVLAAALPGGPHPTN